MARYPQPSNEDEFEEFCLKLLREVWQLRTLERYGRRGQRQHGIDLYDAAGTRPARAVQCKHHALDSVLPEGELTAELAKTAHFPMPLDEYYLLTTAKRDTETQREYLTLCEQQRQRHGCSVFLWTWEEIERHLDSNPNLQLHLPGDFRGVLAAITAAVSRIEPPIPHDAEIDEARALLNSHNPAEARVVLERKKRRHWEQMTARQRYRVAANLGTAALQLGDETSASEYYLLAGEQLTDDFDAQAFRARGLELRGQTADAFAIARLLVQNHKNKRAAAIFIRCAPKDLSIEEVEIDCGDLREEPEALLCLSVRAINTQSYTKALSYADKLISVHSDVADGYMVRGQALLHQQLAKFQVIGVESALDRRCLVDADEALTKAIELNKALGDIPAALSVLSGAYFARHQVRFLLGRAEDSDVDLEESWRLAPDDPNVLVSRAMAIRTHSYELALRYLKSATKRSPNERARFLYGNMQIASGRIDEGIGQLQDLAGAGGVFAVESTVVIVDAQIARRRFDEAEQLVNNTILSSGSRCTLVARIENARGDRDQAVARALDAFASLAREDIIEIRRSLAILLQELGLYDQAFEVWNSFVVRGVDSNDFKNFLRCAYHAGKHDLVLEHCARFTEQGMTSRFYIVFEAHILQVYDPERAYSRLIEALKLFPDDIELMFLCACVSLRTGRRAEAATLLEAKRIPPAATTAVDVAALVVHALVDIGRHEDAVGYVYALLRHHWDEEEAHRLFVATLIRIPETRAEQPTVVGVDTAVCYKDDEGKLTWHVIEPTGGVQSALGETTLDSPPGSLFAGRGVGEAFTLYGGIQPGIVEIVAILNKYSYRLQDVMNNFQVRFPESNNPIQSFKVPEDPDALMSVGSPLVRAAVQRKHDVQSLLDSYREGALSLARLSDLMGVDPIRCQIEMAGSNDGVVRCTVPDVHLLQAAAVALRNRTNVFVDTSAMATFILLDLTTDIAAWPWQFVTTATCREVLRAFVKGMRDSREMGSLGLSGGAITMVPRDPSFANRLADRAEILISRFSVVDAMPLASINAQRRGELEQTLGLWGAEAVACSARQDRVLWTDDMGVAAFAARQGGVPASTQSLFSSAVERKSIALTREFELSTALLVYNYVPLNLPDALIRHVATIAGWRATDMPLSKLVAKLSNAASPEWLRIARIVVVECMLNLELVESREATVIRVLETLRMRRDRSTLLHVLIRSIRGMFSLNVVREDELLEIVQSWAQQADI